MPPVQVSRRRATTQRRSRHARTLASLPEFLRSTFAQTATVSVPARDRVELQALGSNGFADSIGAIKGPGHAVALRVRLAGDGVAGVAVSYSLTGPGSLSAASGVSDSNGEARFDYTSAAAGKATIKATIDGEGSSDTLTITVKPIVTVTVSPKTVTVAPGKTVQFSVQVTGASDPSVSWGAAGGTIDVNGLYTAGQNPGTFAVAAVSNADTTASDTATVVVKSAPAGITRLNNDGTVQAGCSTNGTIIDGRDSPFLATSWSDTANCDATGTDFFGNPITASGHATAHFDESYVNGSLVSITAAGSGGGAGTGDPGLGYGLGSGQAGYEITFSVAATTEITVHANVSTSGAGGDARVYFRCAGTTPLDLGEVDQPGSAGDLHQLGNVTVTVAGGTTCQVSAGGGSQGDPVVGSGSASFAVDVSFG